MSDYHINYNGVEYTIDPIIFSQCSPVFKEFYNPDQTMRIDYELPPEAFEQFLPAVQGKPVQITRDNVSNLRRFAIEWQAEDLLRKVEDFEFFHSISTILERFQNNISKNQPVDEFIPSLAENIDFLIKNPQFATVPQKHMKSIIEHPKCNISDYHSFFRFIIGYANLHKSVKEKSILNYIDVSRLDMSEINELFDINIISVQNPSNNSNLPDLLKNLVFFLHDSYHESKKKVEDARKQLQSKEKQVGSVCHELRYTKKQIIETQHRIDEIKRKESQSSQEAPPPAATTTKKYSDKPRRGGYSKRPPMNKRDMVYTPPQNSNSTSNNTTPQ